MRANLFFRGKIFPFSRFIVREESMISAYKPGDHVLTYNWGRPNTGDVIVFAKGDEYYIKRVDKIAGGLVYVSGDNKQSLRPAGLKQSLRPAGLKQSLRSSGLKNFSAKMKPIKTNWIIGRVIYKY